MLRQPNSTSLSTSTAPSILFLQIKVSKREETYEAKIVNKTEVAGILDRDSRGIQLFENQWLISLFDNKQKLLEQTTLANPLEEHFEVADDKGQFKNVEVKKQEAEFFFRIQNNPRFAMIQIEQILPSEKKKKLFSLTF